MQRKNRLAVFEHVPHKDRSVKNVESKVTKRARSPEHFEDNPTKVKRRKQGIRATCEPLNLSCDYDSCDFVTENYNEFLKHIDSHLSEVSVETDHIECMWENCSFETSDIFVLKQHLNFHGYHTRLKNIGSNLLERTKLPECTDADIFEIPTLSRQYDCEWIDCDLKFLEYQSFLDHVKCHVYANPATVNNKEEGIKCRWQGCVNKYPTKYKLQDHVRTHTKERVAACPTCGCTFASKTKFIDHRKRQMREELQGYQCSQCSKLFASERLLRDHMRIHINHYKCHLCDMTCPKPSMLAKHIRYRHLPDRPFKCDICSHSTVSYQDLVTHRGTHNGSNAFECDKCDYKCLSKWTFEKHHAQKHDKCWEPKYACHCCDKMFSRGALLTKHLIKIHDFHWPSGHSRFLYKQDVKTGLYHLQVVRYESLEVTQEMIQGNAAYQHALTQNYKYECEQSQEKPYSYTLKIANKGQEQPAVKNKRAETSDGDGFKYELFDPDNTAYESDDTDNLVICS